MYLYSIIFLLTATLTFAQEPGCGRGSFIDGTNCTLCPPGTFSGIRNATSCSQCPPGTYNPVIGAQGEDVCRECPRNTTSTVQGAISIDVCRSCPPGQVSSGSDSLCGTCPPGSVASRFGGPSLICDRCREGTYQQGNECLDCPGETSTTSPGASSLEECQPCPFGTVFNDDRCRSCLSGSIFNNETRTCERCPQGTFRTSLSTCTKCPIGQIASNAGSSRCVPCPDGFTTMTPGASFCRRIDGPCPPDFFVTASGDCLRCDTGFRLRMDRGRCVRCARKNISPGGTVTSCTRCTGGSAPNDDGDQCFCQAGHERRDGRCQPCNRGEFQPFGPTGFVTEDLQTCRTCPEGRFASKRGMSECTPCPEGTVSEKRGRSRCNTCREGLIVSNTRGLFGVFSRCVVPASNCPPRFRRRSTRVGFQSSFCRRRCPEGTFYGRTFGRCVSCEPGTGRSRFGCQFCSFRQFSLGGSSRCMNCPQGFRRDSEDGTKCVCAGPSAAGRQLVDGRCRRCRRGFFNDGSRTGNATCIPCPRGTIPNESRTQCVNCPIETFTESEGASECVPCPAGTFTYGLGEPECIPLMTTMSEPAMVSEAPMVSEPAMVSGPAPLKK